METKVPPKVPNVSWRTATNCLPTLDRLRSCVVVADEACPCCRRESETSLHVFFHFESVREVWTRSGLGVLPLVSKSFYLCMQAIILNHDSLYVEQFLMLLWSIWHTRNAYV